jgi:hypothetical protein
LLFVLLAGLAGLAVDEKAVDFAPAAARLHCGVVLRVRHSDAAVEWVDMEAALRQRRWQPVATPVPELLRSRSPLAGMAYVTVTVLVEPGRSLGRLDYELVTSARRQPCLALRRGPGAYDFRLWEIRSEAGPQEVELLFEVPLEVESAQLKPALAVEWSLPAVNLDFTAETAAAESEPGAAAGEPRAAPEPSGLETEQDDWF